MPWVIWLVLGWAASIVFVIGFFGGANRWKKFMSAEWHEQQNQAEMDASRKKRK